MDMTEAQVHLRDAIYEALEEDPDVEALSTSENVIEVTIFGQNFLVEVSLYSAA